MFFPNLIASCLLACGVASSSVRVSHDQMKEQQNEQMYLDSHKSAYSTTNTLKGQYVFKYWDTDFTTPYYSSWNDFDFIDVELGIVSLYCEMLPTGYNSAFCRFGFNDSGYEQALYGELRPVKLFNLFYDQLDGYITVRVAFDDDRIDEYFIYPNGVTPVTDSALSVEDFVVYFNDYVTLTDNQLKLFKGVFTDYYDDSIFTTYTGWYYMTTSFSSATPHYYATCCGNFLYCGYVGNYLIEIRNYVQGAVNNLSIDLDFYSSGRRVSFIVFPRYEQTNQFYQGQHNVLMTDVFMPLSSYRKFETYGQFEYVYDHNDYGMDDLFISIADTPITFLTSMFNFELFGTTFYVAVMGIITVIAIFYIVKKVL